MKKQRKGIFIVFCVLLTVLIVCAASLFIVFSPLVNLYGQYDINLDKLDTVSNTINFYSKDRKIEFSEYNKGKYLDIETLPSYVYNAFVSVEDKRFYSHNGVDYVRVVGALLDNLKEKKFKEGASTITQQLVKNTILSSDKTIERKIKEIKIAQRVEKKYTKKEILEKYLNAIYFGSNLYGLENASEYYFNKSASKLSIEESAFLASIINNPTLYNPYSNKENLNKRKDLILGLMRDNGYITNEEYENAINNEIEVKKGSINTNQYYNNVINLIKNMGISLTNGQLNVTIPLDVNLSEKVKAILENNVDNFGVNLIIADNQSGEILTNLSNFRYDITASKFLPGSTIKPILCYAPLVENNEIYTISQVEDKPYSINDYFPQNFNEVYRGKISQSQALAYSSNSVALQNLEKIGIKNAINFARKTGLSFDEEDYNNYAIALGGLKYGFTLNELLSSYITLARNGNKITPLYLNCIDNNNSVVFLNKENQEQVMKSSTAFLTSEMLRDCAQFGTAKTLKKHSNLRAKTGTVGTEKGNKECYCIAFSPKYTVLCHISSINNELLPLSIMGGTLPTKIVGQIFDILADNSTFEMPNTVVKKEIVVDELNNGNVVLAPWYEKEINKKSCYFSKENIPPLNNSFSDFMNNYELGNSYHFDIFDSLAN